MQKQFKKKNKSRVPHRPVERSEYQGEGNEGNVLQGSREVLRGVGAPAGCEGDAGLCHAARAATWALPPFSAAPTPDERARPVPRSPLESRPLEGARAVQAASPAAPRRPAPPLVARTHLSRLESGWLEEPRPPPPEPPPPLEPPPPPPKPEESRFPDSSFSTAGRCPVRAASSSSCSFPIPRAAAPRTPTRGHAEPAAAPKLSVSGQRTPQTGRGRHPLSLPRLLGLPPPAARHFRDPASRVTAPPRPASLPT
ncbi:hypothetical protein LEMLEM_LOCUS13959 [Lemmus lemmus]